MDLCAYAHKPAEGYLLKCYLLFCEGEGLVLESLEDKFGEFVDGFFVFEDVVIGCFVVFPGFEEVCDGFL